MSRHRAKAVWSGTVPAGSGTMQLGLAGPVIPYTLTARVEEEAGTNPEQLLAAALAGCFSMSLANLLEEAGLDVDALTIETKATAHLEQTETGFGIPRIDLVVRGSGAELEENSFVALADQAKRTCPVSKLYASAEITLDAAVGTF